MIDQPGPIVVDTDVVSFLFSDRPLAPTYDKIVAGRSLLLSLMSVAEIEYGMTTSNWGKNRRDLMRRFLARFTVLQPDLETAMVWARVKSGCEKKGRPIDFADNWIAAAALQSNRPLVTHNARHFAHIEGLAVLTASVES